MTDSTKQLFDAPWVPRVQIVMSKVENENRVVDCKNRPIAICGKLDAHRIAHLPELYDALLDVLTCRCNVCMGHVYGKEIVHPEQIEDCPVDPDVHNRCPDREYWKLLKKVRGESEDDE